MSVPTPPPSPNPSLVALNGAAALAALVGIVTLYTGTDDFAIGALLLAALVLTVNGVRAAQRPSPLGSANPREVDLLDAGAVLDLDARLDALERSEHRRRQTAEIAGALPHAQPLVAR